MKAIKQIIDPRSQEWYLSRLSKFSSSELYKLIGTGKKKGDIFTYTGLSYIYEKVSETFSGELPDPVSSPSMAWGIMNEPIAIFEFERAYLQTVETGTFYDLPDLFCGTPDGETINHVLEIKCPYNGGIHIGNTLIRDNESLKSKRPDHYWQIQGNMHLSGKDRAYFISFDPRLPPPVSLHVVEILICKEDMNQAIDKIKMAIEFKDRMMVHLAAQKVA